MTLETGIQLLETIFMNTASLGGSSWILQLTAIVGTLALLTRKVSDWKTLAFPVVVGWNTFITVGGGVSRIPALFMVATGMMFVLETLSLETISSAIGGVKGFIGDRRGIRPKARFREFREDRELKAQKQEKSRIDIQEELKELRKYRGLTGEIRRKEKNILTAKEEAEKEAIKEEYKRRLKKKMEEDEKKPKVYMSGKAKSLKRRYEE